MGKGSATTAAATLHVLLLHSFHACAAASNYYYVSPLGNDAADGTSPSTPWATTKRVNAQPLLPGDSILFDAAHGNHTNVNLIVSHNGTSDAPISIRSYGGPRSTLLAGAATANGVLINAAAYVQVSDLSVFGGGAPSNAHATCVSLWTDGGAALPGVTLSNIETVGCSIGVYIGSSACGGFTGVRMANISAHHNRDDGILVGSNTWPMSCYAHSDVSITDSIAFNNSGNPANTGGWSGSGIVFSSVNGALITRCTAYHNGGLNAHAGGGPVGIWAYNANNVTISHSVSYRNSMGSGTLDGGGFDLDGGASNSVLEYNLAFDNAGPGFLVCQFNDNTAWPTLNNTLRYSVSYLDGVSARNGAAGIELYTPDVLHGLDVLGNTFISGPSSIPGQSQAAAASISGGLLNVRFRRNALLSTGGGGGGGAFPAVVNAASGVGVVFTNNSYWTTENATSTSSNNYTSNATSASHSYRTASAAVDAAINSTWVWEGASYGSLSAWRAATGQEQSSSAPHAPTGWDVDPQLLASTSFFQSCVEWDVSVYPTLPNSEFYDAVRGFAGCG